jgi:AcrR family transcriptional regulator
VTAPVRRPRARRGEGDRLRAEILDAASQLLLRTADREAVSIRAVADAVGVTPPSIYLHFADKAELINAVCLRHFVDLDQYIKAAVEGIEDPLEELLHRGKAYVRFGREHPEQYRILFMSRPDPSEQPPDEQFLAACGFNALMETVDRAMTGGAIARQDPVLVATGLWTVVHGITSLAISMAHYPLVPLERLVDHLLETHGRGLRA